MAVSRAKRKKAADAVVVTEEDADEDATSDPDLKLLLEAQKSITAVRPYTGEIPDWVPSGSYLLDMLLSGGAGYPVTKFIHLMGAEGAGKTILCLDLAHKVLEAGGIVFWYNQEDGWSWPTAEMMGISKGHPRFKLFPPMLAEKCFDAIAINIKTLGKSHNKRLILFVVDSLGGSVTLDRDELEIEKGRKMGDIQKLAKDLCAKTVPYLPMTRAMIAVTNHVYVDINSPAMHKPTKSTGGKAIPYRAWIELEVSAMDPTYRGDKLVHFNQKIRSKKNKGYSKKLDIQLPIFIKRKANRFSGFDDGYTCLDYLIREGIVKPVVRNKEKVVLLPFTGKDGQEIYGDVLSLRDRYYDDAEFRKQLRRVVKERFERVNGLD